MTLLEIIQSEYIFKQDKQLGIIGSLFCLALIIYAIFLFRKGRKSVDENKRQIEDFRAIVLILFSLAIWFFGFMPVIKNSLKLKRNGVEVTGKTIEWIKVKGSNRYIKYCFIANGQFYTAQCGFVYDGQRIPRIVCPNGRYIVIYDKEDPANSVMDFKRRKD